MAQPRLAAGLTRLLSSVAAPVYLLDDERRIVYANAACAAWLRVELEQLVGRVCSFHSSVVTSAEDAVVAGLCPPPEAFAGQRHTAIVSAGCGNGPLIRRRAEFIPLYDDGANSLAVLVVVETTDLPPHEAASAIDEAADPGAEATELHEQLRTFHAALRGTWQLDRLAGVSPAIERVRTQVRLAAETAAATLIVGRPGSGREHVARAIHHSPPGAESSRLIPLSCSTLGAELLQSTLAAALGNRDVRDARPAGTLLLNDVEELPAEAQAELAARLKRGSPGVRIISTATATLEAVSEKVGFRRELACALSTIVIQLPTLAERREDVPLLAQMFVEEFNAEGYRQHRGFTSEALDQLAAYPWPGNIDELAAIVREAHGRAEGSLIAPADLPQRIYLAAAASRRPRRDHEPIQLEAFLAGIERELIERALRLAKGNKTKAAGLLSLTRPRLYRRMVQLGLEKERA